MRNWSFRLQSQRAIASLRERASCSATLDSRKSAEERNRERGRERNSLLRIIHRETRRNTHVAPSSSRRVSCVRSRHANISLAVHLVDKRDRSSVRLDGNVAERVQEDGLFPFLARERRVFLAGPDRGDGPSLVVERRAVIVIARGIRERRVLQKCRSNTGNNRDALDRSCTADTRHLFVGRSFC